MSIDLLFSFFFFISISHQPVPIDEEETLRIATIIGIGSIIFRILRATVGGQNQSMGLGLVFPDPDPDEFFYTESGNKPAFFHFGSRPGSRIAGFELKLMNPTEKKIMDKSNGNTNL